MSPGYLPQGADSLRSARKPNLKPRTKKQFLPLLKHTRRAEFVCLLLALSLCCALAACVPSYTLNTDDPNDPNNELAWVGPEMPNARLQLAGRPICCDNGGPCSAPDQMECRHLSYDRSNTLWLSSDDLLTARWDDFILFTHSHDGVNETCSYCVAANGCNLYTLINSPPESKDPLVVAYEGFVQESEPILIGTADVYSGCPDPQTPRNQFPVAGSGTYQIVAPRLSSNRCVGGGYACDGADLRLRAIVGEPMKVFVVGDTSLVTTYQMDRYVEAAYPFHVWYRWSSASDPVWNETFSRNVRVTKVRILKGLPSLDSTTGKYVLAGATVVRPSRVILTPDFSAGESVLAGSNDAMRCYADMSEDGNINVARCRGSNNSNSTNLQDATPTYAKVGPADRLTWFAEFNPCEGCGAPPCGNVCTTGATEPSLVVPGSVLAIEFTIEKVN
jgi:hypothetical protein